MRRLSRALASAAALTLLVTPVVAVAATDDPLESSTPTIDPNISELVRVGETLRARAGTWTSGTTFTYQWFADGEPISGATEFDFRPTAAERAKRLTVRLEGSREGYTSVSRTSGATDAVEWGRFAQAPPRILGVATPGATLTVFRPSAVPAPDSVEYRWWLDGERIRGATRTTLTVRPEWRGHLISVRMYLTKPGYLGRLVPPSAGVRVGGAYSMSPNPVIFGTKRVGSTLTATRGTWSPTPSSFSFQWYSDGRPISGATTSKYTLTGSDYQKKITVIVRTYRAGWGTAARRSAATVEVLASAVRWQADDLGRPLSVGEEPNGVVPTTYIAQAGSGPCVWVRQRSDGTELARDEGSGQRLFTVLPIDHSVWTNHLCGVWVKYYPGMVRTSYSTAAHGVYVLGDHLEYGTYSTTGPVVAGEPCTYTLSEGFYGEPSVVSSGVVTEPTTIRLDGSGHAYGFATAGCAWQRID
ncbi:hypothetical protein [Promicromonospora sukumoe]|uniref:hypothetical protein n=1 Tax=Promicromonospora sukumoe TaxID=88382 RepID=UPI00037878DB|nr:hypothetical protein [Promicromonospora sukumoe]